MTWVIRIIFIVSIAINCFFIYDEIRDERIKEFSMALNRALGGEITKTTWQQGLEVFRKNLKNKNESLLNKKYFYINVWADWCIPCIKEMPWLDSIAGTINKDVAYVFISDISDEAASNCIKRKKYFFKNFILLNNMNDFVSAICNEKGTNNKSYPMTLILNNKGEVKHFSTGAYESPKDASDLVTKINFLE